MEGQRGGRTIVAMTERVIDRINDLAEQLREQAWEAEKLGRLPDETAKMLKAAGLIRLLQPQKYGGYEAHPREFAETVMTTAALDPASGWICGVVGVHPWQVAFADSRVAEEMWGEDQDIWMASPMRRRAWPSRWTVATSSTGAGNSVPVRTTATGSFWAPCSVTRTAHRSCPRKCCT